MVEPAAPKAPYITVVSGLPRSGTSLMMQMLEAGGVEALTDHRRRPDRDNPEGYYELEAVKKLPRETDWLDDAVGRAVKIVYLLLYKLPLDRRYRVLLMHRRIEEVVASQEVMLERRGAEGSELDDDELAELFRRELAQVGQWLDARPGFRRLDVHFNELIAEPEPQVRRIAAFLDRDLDRQAVIDTIDPSLYRQRA